MIQYYELTDPLRGGEIIRQDGRKHFRFSYGAFAWERTTLFQAYLTEGTAEYHCFRPLSEDEAQQRLLQRGRQVGSMLQKAEALAREAHAYQTGWRQEPYIDHIARVAESLPDWEEKTAAWLHELCNETPWTAQQLSREGFTPRLCRSAALLTRTPGTGYGEYLTALRADRIARRVKIADLADDITALETGRETAQEAARAEQCRHARKYLFGDIPAYSDNLDIYAMSRPHRQIVPAERIYQKIHPLALGGRKVPHGISNPVLRREGEQLYLAFFVYSYTREQLRKGTIGRPVSYILADITTGQLLREVSCSRADFSDAPADAVFSTANPNPKPDQAFYTRVYGMLDAVREEYLTAGTVNTPGYGAYLEQMLQAVPPSYHRFYRELSNP